MATAFSLSYVFNQPRHAWTAIAFSALCLTVINPLVLFQAGFQLSYLIVLSIIALSPVFASGMVFLPPSFRLWLAVPLAAQLGSLPLTAHYFQSFSPLSLLANLLVIPLVGVIVNMGFIALLAGLISPTLALLLNYPNRALLALNLAIVSSLSRLPGASFSASFADPSFVLAWYLGLLGLSRWRYFAGRRKVGAAAAAGIVLIALSGGLLRRPAAGMEAVFFSGESGDIVFVSLPGGKGILIAPDADPFREADGILRPFFTERGIRRLDLLILTQANTGRLGMLNGILRFAAVDEIWDHPYGASALSHPAFLRRVREEGIRYRRLRAGDRLPIGGAEVSVLWPSAEKPPVFTNDLSLVFSLTFRKTAFLFPAQAGKAAQEEMVRRHPDLKAAVLAAPARGSRSRTDEMFLKAVSPRLAVLSQGKKYFGRYPADCGDYLARLGADVHRTGEEGCVIVRSDGEKVWGERNDK
jgi:competence protein ComEC